MGRTKQKRKWQHLQCVVSSAKEGETGDIQVQIYEGVSKSAAADTLHPPFRPAKVFLL